MEKFFYITAWSKEDPAGGILTYTLEGKKLVQHGFSPLAMAGYLCFSPDGKCLYATGAREGAEGAAAFAVLPDGKLEFLNFCPSQGKSTCHCAVSPDGGFLYTANYSSSSFSEFALDGTGRIRELTRVITHTGTGPVTNRQECAHPHFVSITPDGRFLAVTDLGNDTLFCYPCAPGKGIDPAGAVRTPVTPGRGPRHLLFAPENIVYLVTELGNTVISMKYGDGRFTFLDEISLLPEGCVCATKASAVRMSADGRFIVATNRGFDSLVVIAVDGKGGMKHVQTTLSGGNSPRDVNFLPCGNVFAAANEFSDNIYFYDFDTERGLLTPNGLKLTMPRPLCITWR